MTWRTDPSQSCRDWSELEPATRNGILGFIRDAKKIGYTVIVTDTVRTQARQNWLYAQGRTRGGAVVTQTLDSVHLYRRAVDIVVVRGGVARWDLLGELYKKLPPKKYGLELLPWEKPHLQKIGANGTTQRTPASVIAKKLGYTKAFG